MGLERPQRPCPPVEAPFKHHDSVKKRGGSSTAHKGIYPLTALPAPMAMHSCAFFLTSSCGGSILPHQPHRVTDSAGPTVDHGAPCMRCSPLLDLPSAKLTQTPTSPTSHPCWGLQNPMRPHYPCSTWSSCKALLTRPTTNARTYGFETSGHMLNKLLAHGRRVE